MSFRKRWLSLLLVVCMVLSMLPSIALTASAADTWEVADITSLKPTDVVVIVATKSSGRFAMSNGNGTGSAPAAVSVDFTETIPDNVKWNITANNGGYTIRPNDDEINALYCTNANNGVRVGTNANNVFTLDASGYLKHTATNRYLGVYNTQDWRCYTSYITSNIADQTFTFYKLVSDTPAATLTGISLSGTQPTVFTQDDAFSYDGLIVLASYSDGTSGTVTPTSVSTPDMSTAGIKTVTVTYTAGDVTQTATYDITVNAKVTATLTYSENGVTHNHAGALYTGETVTLEAPTGTTPEGYVFVGWLPTEYTTNDTAPTGLLAAGDSYTLSAAASTLYAVYAIEGAGGGGSSDTFTLTSDLTDGDYVFGAINGDARTDNAIGIANATVTGGWLKYTSMTPASGEITCTDATHIWTLTNQAGGGFTLQNKSTGTSLTMTSGTGSGSVGVGGTGTTIYVSVADAAQNTFEVHQSSTATASSGNQLSLNYGSGYGYRMYAQRAHNTGGISTQFRFYKGAAGVTYTGYTSSPAAFESQTLVLDYGLPVSFGTDVTGISATLNGDYGASLSFEQGTAAVNGGVVTFTPTAMLSEAVTFCYQTAAAKTSVTLLPATSVYYEDSFGSDAFAYTGSWSTAGETDDSAVQAADIVGATDANVYGYDPAYANYGQYSLGSAHRATVSQGNSASVEFTFTGTGFDAIGMLSDTTGVVRVEVKQNGTSVANYIVDTYYGYTYSESAVPVLDSKGEQVYVYKYVGEGNGSYIIGDPTNPPAGSTVEGTTVYDFVEVGEGKGDWSREEKTTNWVASSASAALYQIPVMKWQAPSAGTYTVTITAIYSSIYDHLKAGSYDFYFDAVRIYNPSSDPVALEAYAADGEANASYMNLREELVKDVTGGDCTHTSSDWALKTPATFTDNETTNARGRFVKYCTSCGMVLDNAYYFVTATASPALLAPGETAALHYAFAAENTEVLAILNALTFTPVWSSADTAILTCEGATATAVSVGTTHALLELTSGGKTYATAVHSGDITVGDIATYTVSFSVPAGVTAPAAQQVRQGSGISLPTPEGTPTSSAHEYSFVGWTAEAVRDTTTEPSFVAAGASYTPTADTTLRALYSYATGAAGYTLSNVAPAAGDSVILAGKTGDSYYAMVNVGNAYEALTVSGTTATETATNVFTVESNTHGVCLRSGNNYLHMNSSAINVTSNNVNADLGFTANEDGFIVGRYSTAGSFDRWMTFNNGFDVESSEAKASTIYFFILGTGATYFTTELSSGGVEVEQSVYSTTSNSGARGTICTSLTNTTAANYYTGSYTYATLSGQTSSTLLLSLRSLMTTTHTKTTSYEQCKSYATETDCQNEDGTVTLLYSGYAASASDFNGDAPGWNREHVWPQSLGGFGTSGAGADLHHIRPDDVTTNGDRGNKLYGEVTNGTASTATITGANDALGGYYSGNYYEPLDSVKGDVARICLYIYTRYGSTHSDCADLTNVFESVDTLLAWCALDPVDTWEMGRNEVVYEIQGNRNVFIDYPEYAWLIFGKEVPAGYVTPSNPAGYAPAAASSDYAVRSVEAAETRTGEATDGGIYFIDGNGTATLEDYDKYGPANEIYLAAGKAVAFNALFSQQPASLQLGLKAITGTGSTVTVAIGSTPIATIAVNSATELFYDLTDAIQTAAAEGGFSFDGALTITNGDGAVISITSLKWTAAAEVRGTAKAFLTQEELAVALDTVDAVLGNTTPSTDPTDPVDPTDPIAPIEPEVKPEDFTDLDKTAWYYEGVVYTIENGLMNGMSTTVFAPDETLTRAMLVTILYRQAGSPEISLDKLTFTDVDRGRWYAEAIAWALSEGVTNGVTATTFEPESPVTREQMVTFLWRYAEKPTSTQALTAFPDAAALSAYALTPMRWAVETGVIKGDGTGLAPKGEATRAQIATIFMRFENSLAIS